MDVAQDNAPSEGAPADVPRDSSAGDVVGPSDGGGADSTDGAADPCHPACLSRLYGGCPIGGTCVYSAGNFCYSNGVILVFSPAGTTPAETVMKNGVVCATADATRTFKDPSGATLGSFTADSDGSATLSCTGEAPVTIPANCTIDCVSGTCPP